jgi:hypothetical protein
MAIVQVQAAQSAGSSNASTIALSACTAGNLIVSFFSQSNTNTPSAAAGGTALTVHTTKAIFNASAASVWVAYGIAAGGETAVTWTPGTSATGHGVAAWEFSGAANPVALDFATAVHTDNISAATGTTPTVTTTTAGSVVCIGVGGSTSSGTISAWTGTNVATNIGTVAARCFGGRFITTSTISSTFTATWATSGVKGMLAIAFKPASGAVANSLTADPGSYAITGAATTLPVNRPLTASPGAYNLTGVDTSLPIGRVLTANPGAYIVTGDLVDLPIGRVMILNLGSYSVVGADIQAAVNRLLSASPGTYTVSGSPVTLQGPAPPPVSTRPRLINFKHYGFY